MAARSRASRFSAIWRRYAYRVADRPDLVDPLRRGHVLAWPRPLDLDAMERAGAGLLGEHDFAAYCKRRDGATTIRALQTLTWERFARHLTDGGIDLTRRIFQKSLADLKGNYQAIQDMLPHLSIPTVVVWGDKDPFFAVSVGERTARAIPGARLVVYEETGHFVPEEQPERLAAEIARSFV